MASENPDFLTNKKNPNTLNHQSVKNIQGLSEKEAASRLQKEGYNELPSQRKQHVLTIFLHVILEPMLLLLIGAGLIYLFIGEKEDAIMLLFFVFFIIGITFMVAEVNLLLVRLGGLSISLLHE